MPKQKVNVYAIDFDGVLCKDMFPKIGYPIQDNISKVKELKERGNKVVLWTSRTGDRLKDALNWCSEKELEFDAINENLPENIQKYKSDSRKIVADFYIDDRAVNLKDFNSIRGEVSDMEKKLEFRSCTEVRAIDSEDGKMIIEGVVNNLGEWSKVLYGTFKERVNPGAFNKALQDAKNAERDIFFLAQHNTKELPLASINSSTMELKEEENKLKIRAELPPTSLAKDIYELIKSRVLREFSFGFSGAKCEWGLDSDNVRTRTITELTLHEVSIVTTGAYNSTNAEARGFNPVTELDEIEARNNKESEEKYQYEKYQYNKNLCKLKGWC